MADYTDYQQRALYGAGQSAQRAGQRFHMERDAWKRGDKDAAKYHRSRANALNRAGAYAAVRGMGGNEGKNQYFPVQSSGQPIYSTNFPGQFALSSQGKEVFDQFRDSGFVEPIRQKKRYAPNTEPKGLGWLAEKALGNTMMAKVASSILPKKKPKPDDAYYKSLWGQGLNEMYSPSGIFSAGKFLGKPQIDPYYRRPYKGPEFLRGLLEPFVQPRSDAFGVVRDSSIPEDWEFMQETPMDYKSNLEDTIIEDTIIGDTPLGAVDRSDNWFYPHDVGLEDVTLMGDLPPIEPETDEIFNEEIFNNVYKFPESTGFTNFPYAFEGPWNLFEAAKENMEEGEWTDQELLDRLLKTGYLIDKTMEEE